VISAQAKNKVVKLVVEYHENPIGIDVEKPRFSWQILSDETNVTQNAYEIRVANLPEEFNKKSSLLWSTGKVESNQSVHI
jgi:alpha-L-rhamnosidase